jgi:rhamnose utilization protein RhaD (predicted bifunctional aldolase and dehydrogenase)
VSTDKLLEELIVLSREAGREERQLAILGEGNTSAAVGDGTFWVKASGTSLSTANADSFSHIRMDVVLAYVERAQMSEIEVGEALADVLVDPQHKRPSTETFMHAVLLSEGGAHWVAHTHPNSANMILCSQLGAEPFKRPLFPDGIVVCGRHPAIVPYVDPGFYLGHAVRNELRRYQDAHGKHPKLLLMVNHGITALGQTAQEALNILRMADKWSRILLGTYALGGPHYMPDEEAQRIDTRLDEEYRRKMLVQAR